MHFTSEEHDVGAIVLDGCSTTVRNMVYAQAKERSIPKPLLTFFMPGLTSLVKIFYNYKEVDPIAVIANIKSPVFFIHEEKDDLVTMTEMRQLFGAAKNPDNEIWEISGALHSQCYIVDPAGYVNRLDSFFAGNLKQNSSVINDDNYPILTALTH